MIKLSLFTLVLVLTTNTVAMAGDFDEALAAYGRGDYSTAFAKFTKVATAPSPPLDGWLARARPDNPGVSDDDLTAYWLNKYGTIHEADRTDAHFYLGVMYALGRGVPQDYGQAVLWYRKAAASGIPEAQFNLARLYAHGEGVPQDYQHAVGWYTKAAEAGHAGAQHNLALIYDDGNGVPQNYREALRWYTKAAEQGHVPAQNNLGLMYGIGHGVPQDYVQAHKWYNLAAASANNAEDRALAAKNREIVARKMAPQQLAEAQTLARQWKPMREPDASTGGASRSHEGADKRPSLDREILKGIPLPPLAPQADEAREEATPIRTGTGFVVSRQGHVLTNHHVIKACRTVEASMEGRKQAVTVVGTDVENDLAALQLPTPVSSMARFREGRTIRPGDGVVVVGFPLAGLLASEAQVATGTVSALAGLGNNTRFLQITAPVQPGNSGGPLLDQSGNIVGVVVSKLNALTITRTTGDIPQNFNFAINGAISKSFLDSYGVEYDTAASTRTIGSADVAAAARKFTLLIECYR